LLQTTVSGFPLCRAHAHAHAYYGERGAQPSWQPRRGKAFFHNLRAVLGDRRLFAGTSRRITGFHPGTIISLRNNRIMGNAINGKVTKSIPQQ